MSMNLNQPNLKTMRQSKVWEKCLIIEFLLREDSSSALSTECWITADITLGLLIVGITPVVYVCAFQTQSVKGIFSWWQQVLLSRRSIELICAKTLIHSVTPLLCDDWRHHATTPWLTSNPRTFQGLSRSNTLKFKDLTLWSPSFRGPHSAPSQSKVTEALKCNFFFPGKPM